MDFVILETFDNYIAAGLILAGLKKPASIAGLKMNKQPH
jgi:hypothetical protein